MTNEIPVVVIPACDKDCVMAIKSLEWQYDMGACRNYRAVVARDGGMNQWLGREVVDKAQLVYGSVDVFEYDPPQIPRWPYAANWAWQATAMFVEDEIGKPWYWAEPDAVPLRPGWLDEWFGEYVKCGMPIMGSIVDGRGHCNGTAIYPANMRTLSPAAMKSVDVAWDFVMREDTAHLVHHTDKMFHCWGIVNGMPHPYNGEAATFPTQKEVDMWIPKNAVIAHRSKDGTLIDRLRERMGPRVLPPNFVGGRAFAKI